MKKILLFLGLASSAFALEEHELVWDSQPPSVTELNSALQEAIAAQDWWSVIDYADTIAYHYPDSPFGQEAAYQCGETYFHMKQYEQADQCFSAYLNQAGSPKHFEEAIQYKFKMAELYRNGLKRKLFDSHKMPRFAPSEEGAIALYDEVITTLPHQEIAAQSLLGKAKVQIVMEDFKDAVETLQLLIRRFPKHELAAEGYLEINRSYLKQCQVEHLDLDLLELSEMNFRKFQLAFPRESRLEDAQKALSDMQELYAANLLNTGRYYEKIKKTPASIIFYTKVVAKYPATKAAGEAKIKLEQLQADGKI
ncbi:MAG: outer membrane protein assembly factor BamD [Verrucomicrobia bacterium]|nr:outer membrane protein assembly factor BamD [Verrucomicrobiota bacterium]